MRSAFRWSGPAFLLLGLFVFLFVAGCGGGDNSLKLVEPVEQGDEGSVCGTLYALVDGVIDIPGNIDVTLTPIDPPTNPTYTAVSNVTGSYQIPGVKKGAYKVSAEATSAYLPGLTIAGEVNNVVVRGGIPSLNVNILLGDPEKNVTFSGVVTENGIPAKGAVVSMEVLARPFASADPEDQRAAYVSTLSGNGGNYSITVPDDKTMRYLLSAHTATSDLYETDFINPPLTADMLVNNLTLTTVSKPVATPVTLYLMSVRLPEPTVKASADAAMSRLAVARLTKAPASRIASFERMSQGRTASVRAASNLGIVENALTWEGEVSWDVQGFYLYRAPALNSVFTKIGLTRDPEESVFIDNDPALPLDAPTYYTVTSYAAQGVVSKPATPVKAMPLPPITGITTETLETNSLGKPSKIKLSWDSVPGAMCFFVLAYTEFPTFNSPTDQIATKILDNPKSTSCVISHPSDMGDPNIPVTYWWSIAAFNLPANQAWMANSAAYSSYHQLAVYPKQ